MVVVHEVPLLDFIVSHLYTAAQFGQDHHLDVLVFQINGVPHLVVLLVRDGLDDRIRIDNAAATLIHSFFQKYGDLLGFSHLIGRDDHLFFPSFYHSCCFIYIYTKNSRSDTKVRP